MSPTATLVVGSVPGPKLRTTGKLPRPIVQIHRVLLAVVADDDIQVAVAVHVPHHHRWVSS